MSDETAPILFLLGATHHTAPLELRERLALEVANSTSFMAPFGRSPACGSSPS